MALVLSGFTGVVTLVDQGGKVVRKEYELREAATYATALADLQTIVSLLDPITNAAIRGYSIRTEYEDDAFAFPTGGVEVENVAQLIVALETENKYEKIFIPAPIDGIFLASFGKGYDVVDVGDAALFAYVDGVYSTTDGVAYISDGETVKDLAAIQSGKRIHRASNLG